MIETALGGKEATEIWEGERKYPVVVRLREEQRADLASIGRILIDTPKGMRIPLGDVATLSVRGGSMNIATNPASAWLRSVCSCAAAIWAAPSRRCSSRVREDVALPPGYFLQWGGEFENQQRAMARLKVIVPLSIFLIFLLLFHAFGSVKSARPDSLQHPAGAGGRHPGPAHHRNPAQRFRRDRLHRPVRTGGAERRGHRQLLQHAARPGTECRTRRRWKARWSASGRSS